MMVLLIIEKTWPLYIRMRYHNFHNRVSNRSHIEHGLYSS